MRSSRLNRRKYTVRHNKHKEGNIFNPKQTRTGEHDVLVVLGTSVNVGILDHLKHHVRHATLLAVHYKKGEKKGSIGVKEGAQTNYQKNQDCAVATIVLQQVLNPTKKNTNKYRKHVKNELLPRLGLNRHSGASNRSRPILMTFPSGKVKVSIKHVVSWARRRSWVMSALT